MLKKQGIAIFFSAGVLLTSAVSSLASAPSPQPQLFTAEYDVYASGLRVGRTVLKLREYDNDSFRASYDAKPTGLASAFKRGTISEASIFTADDMGALIGKLYTMNDTLSSDEETLKLRFDWPTATAHGNFNGGNIEFPITPSPNSTLDRLSFQIAVIHDLNNGQLRERYEFIDGDRIKIYKTERLGDEQLRVRGKLTRTIKLKHQRQGSSRANFVWHAPELGYLPVRIEQSKRGKVESRAVLKKHHFVN